MTNIFLGSICPIIYVVDYITDEKVLESMVQDHLSNLIDPEKVTKEELLRLNEMLLTKELARQFYISPELTMGGRARNTLKT